jgi:8-oxo-dGTP diphosphatase
LPLRPEVRLHDSPVPAPPMPAMLVVAVALIDDENRVLMQQRNLGGVHGGLWEFPGGKLEPGESPEHAAVRELAEELGIVLDIAALEPVGFASGRTASVAEGGKGPARPLVILLYTARAWAGTPRPLEAADLCWCAPAGIAALAMPPLDYPLAEALCRHLSSPVPINLPGK